jgi:REP element-mobilizing transposase RayT
MVQWFKTMTTNEYIRGVKSKQFPPFEKSVWQRNYFEHIIRDEDDLVRILQYIINNPANWKSDTLFVNET